MYKTPEMFRENLDVCIGGSRGGVRDARPPWASKFFRFHAVFGKIWRVHAPPGGFTPPLGKILDPPLVCYLIESFIKIIITKYKITD